MAKHIRYIISSRGPAPAGFGDAQSWFLYYKFNVGGETWVPHNSAGAYAATPDGAPEVGDYLWFFTGVHQQGYELLGAAKLLRVFEDPMSDAVELWYCADDIVRPPRALYAQITKEVAPQEVFERLLTSAFEDTSGLDSL